MQPETTPARLAAPAAAQFAAGPDNRFDVWFAKNIAQALTEAAELAGGNPAVNLALASVARYFRLAILTTP